MNNRERALAVLNYETYDRLPLVHFGFWEETLRKWAAEGHLSAETARSWKDGNAAEAAIARSLGFDFNWLNCFTPNTRWRPAFEEQVLEVMPDGARKVLNVDGVIILQKDDTAGIPPEVDHLLKGRREWEELFLPKLQFSAERVTEALVNNAAGEWPYHQGGCTYLAGNQWSEPYGLHCGSLFGFIRDFVGMVNLAYLQVDDPGLFDEIIRTVGELCCQCTQAALVAGAHFDFAHFWEDICYKGGPLINPNVFRRKVGPHYRRITDLVRGSGIGIVSLDCDGVVDTLVPIWLDNGVDTMFPIEVGTWKASLKPWREKYGRAVRGVGGMDKRVFAYDYAAIDAEIERLKPLVGLGGYLPCPDHRIPPDAKWENVQYYCEAMRRSFG
jgi:hypothetical protein